MQVLYHYHISCMYLRVAMAPFDARTEVQTSKRFIRMFLMQFGGAIIQMAQLQELERLAQYMHLVTHWILIRYQLKAKEITIAAYLMDLPAAKYQLLLHNPVSNIIRNYDSLYS